MSETLEIPKLRKNTKPTSTNNDNKSSISTNSRFLLFGLLLVISFFTAGAAYVTHNNYEALEETISSLEEELEKLIPSKEELERLEKELYSPGEILFWDWAYRQYRTPSAFSLDARRVTVLRALATFHCNSENCKKLENVLNFLLRLGKVKTVCSILEDMPVCCVEVCEKFFLLTADANSICSTTNRGKAQRERHFKSYDDYIHRSFLRFTPLHTLTESSHFRTPTNLLQIKRMAL